MGNRTLHFQSGGEARLCPERSARVNDVELGLREAKDRMVMDKRGTAAEIKHLRVFPETWGALWGCKSSPRHPEIISGDSGGKTENLPDMWESKWETSQRCGRVSGRPPRYVGE